MQKIFVLFLVVLLFVPASTMATPVNYGAANNEKNPHNESEEVTPVFEDASVHDPSVIKAGDYYYVFGSHLAAAKTKDLMKWEVIEEDGADSDNRLFEDVTEELKETFEWAETDTLWAADVTQLEDGRYYMYYNACRGDSPRSAMGVAVADNIEGPYEDLGIILKSGMRDGEEDVDGTPYDHEHFPENYDATVHPNVVDPHTFFDKDGKLWMMYGSYSGGFFILEMDPETGMPIPGQGYGKKLLGGNHSRIEAPYVVYNPETDYYYMYLSYGGLTADGGYNIRVARSKNPDGPYYDSEGNNMIDAKGEEGTFFDDRSIEPYGVKLMGNYLFERKIGDPGTGIGTGYVSPGHNSAYYDEETGKQYLIFHSRFPQTGEMHQIRVHQLFMNEDGWPVAAPYRYADETLEKVYRDDIIGTYKFINHGKDISAELKKSEYITLEKNNKVTGVVDGKWKKTAHNKAELTIDGETYKGVFLRQWDTTSESYRMTFTALSEKGVAVWGSRILDWTDEEVVEAVKSDLSLGDTSAVVSDLTLPTEGTRESEISWSSSDSDIVSEEGVVTRPEAGSGEATVELTATISKGDVFDTKTFEITVLPEREKGLLAHYEFEGNLVDTSGNFAAGNVTGDRIYNSGGTISYADGKVGEASYFDGTSGVKLPNGLILGNEYSVSLWLNPETVQPFTTTFFGGYNDPQSWISLLPRGHDFVNNDTMLWSGNAWYDAGTDTKINTNEWSHLAFTVDHGEIKVYVNGEEKFSGTNFPDVFKTPESQFSLGVNWWDTPYHGLMDELQIYHGKLTAEEVAELANH
ncbi:LamG-like jellyroll fold domain-containing protein [Aquibacillus albus]|nr:glycoside hydrolase family 43 C-terminal domain-containing protein [Aquibacillus albus]